jgi:vitamin B12 transporter
VGYSGSAGDAWYNASATGLYTRGIRVCAADAPVTADCYSSEPRQGYWSQSLALSGGYRWGETARLSLNWLRARGDTRYDGNVFAFGDSVFYSPNESKVLQQALGAKLQFAPLGSLGVSFTAGQSVDQEREYYDRIATGFFNTRRNTLSWLNELRWRAQRKLLFGADYEHDTVTSDTTYAVSSRDNIGVFGLYQWTPGNFELQLSSRRDHNQQFGDHNTGSVGAAYRVSETLRLTASYGTGFKAPTFNDLYFPLYGNPAFQPETSRSAEIGANGRVTVWNWALNAYQTGIDHLIEPSPVTFMAENVDRARIRGLEGQLGTQWSGWRVQLALTWLDPRDRAPGPGFNNLLPRRPQETARLDLDRDFQSVSIGTTLYVAGRCFEDPGNTERLGGYGTVDLRATRHLTNRWLVQGLITNALNKDYQTVLYYNQPGRSAYLTVRYSPT